MELEGQGTGLSDSQPCPSALSPDQTMRKQSSPFSFTSFSKMVIKSYLKLQGKDDYRWKFDKLGGGIFSLIRYMPLVVQVCQLPSFAIAGIQHHSTMISLYNAPIMLKIAFFRFTK